MLVNNEDMKTATVVIAGGVGTLLGLERCRGQCERGGERAISFYSTAYINSNL